MPEIQFVEEWATNTPIDWWNDCRKKLNKVIRRYNKWQTKKDFDAGYGIKLLALIRHGQDTIGSRDGGSGYRSLLDNMEKHILFVLDLDPMSETWLDHYEDW